MQRCACSRLNVNETNAQICSCKPSVFVAGPVARATSAASDAHDEGRSADASRRASDSNRQRNVLRGLAGARPAVTRAFIASHSSSQPPNPVPPTAPPYQHLPTATSHSHTGADQVTAAPLPASPLEPTEPALNKVLAFEDCRSDTSSPRPEGSRLLTPVVMQSSVRDGDDRQLTATPDECYNMIQAVENAVLDAGAAGTPGVWLCPGCRGDA